MKISSKGRYAVRVLAELGKQNKRLSVADLAKLQGITVKYLEQIISLLLKHNLIASSRGQAGGYMLIKDPKDYTIAEILQATDDLPKLAPCLTKNKECERYSVCKTIGYWEKLSKVIVDYLSSTTLEDIINNKY